MNKKKKSGKILILGTGPAGVSAALYITRAGLDVTLISRGGGALSKAEKIENYYGFSTPPTGAELEANGLKGAIKLGAKVLLAEAVGLQLNNSCTGYKLDLAPVNEEARAALPDELKEIFKNTENAVEENIIKENTSLEADAVIITAGAGRISPPLPGVKELEGRGVSYCAICDAFFYKNKTVAVFGAGEYALHEAEILLPHAKKVYLCTDGKTAPKNCNPEIEVITDKLKAVKSGTPTPADEPQTSIFSLGGNAERVNGVEFENGKTIATDGVFIAYGTAGSTDLAKKAGAATDGKNISIDSQGRTNVPGIFAAGDCTGGLLQVAKAVHEGAEAALTAIKFVRAGGIGN